MGNSTIAALRHAVPYLHLFRHAVFVIKIGGEAFVHPTGAHAFLEQVAVLHSLGIRVVVVHGGGAQADQLAQKLGISFEKIGGRRVTSPEMLRTMQQTLNGEVQAELLSAARKLGVRAVGLSGMDAGLIYAERRSPVPQSDGSTLDLGQVGDIVEVRAEILESLLQEDILPIVSPLCGDEQGQWLNVNADTVAAELAVALGADKAVFMTGPAGVLRDVEDPNSLLSEISLDELQAMETSGALQGGMLPKAAAIARCIRGGVPRVHVVSFKIADALLTEIFTNEGSGTLIQGAA